MFERTEGVRMHSRLFHRVEKIRDAKQKVVDEDRRAAAEAAAHAMAAADERELVRLQDVDDDASSYDELANLDARSSLAIHGRASNTDTLARLFG